MDDALLVRVGEAREELPHDVDRARRLEPALFVDQLVEAAPAHELHHDVRLRPMQAEIDDRHAVRMLELRHQLGFALEAFAAFHRRRQCRVHDLDRDRAIELQPRSAIHDPHGAGGEPFQDLVAVVDNFTAEVIAGHASRLSAGPCRSASTGPLVTAQDPHSSIKRCIVEQLCAHPRDVLDGLLGPRLSASQISDATGEHARDPRNFREHGGERRRIGPEHVANDERAASGSGGS